MWRAALVVAIVLAGVACSGDDDAVPPTSALVTTPPTTEVTAVPTTAGDVATSVPPPPTSGDSTVETSPPETSTSVPTPPLTADEQAVVDAVVASWTAWNDVLLDPFDDARVEVAALTRTGPALDRLAEVAADRRAGNIRSATNPDLEARIEVYAETLVFEDGDQATVDYCRIDSNISVEISGNPDGTDRVVDDTVSAVLERDTFVRIDGNWLKESGVQIERFEGASECDRSE